MRSFSRFAYACVAFFWLIVPAHAVDVAISVATSDDDGTYKIMQIEVAHTATRDGIFCSSLVQPKMEYIVGMVAWQTQGKDLLELKVVASRGKYKAWCTYQYSVLSYYGLKEIQEAGNDFDKWYLSMLTGVLVGVAFVGGVKMS